MTTAHRTDRNNDRRLPGGSRRNAQNRRARGRQRRRPLFEALEHRALLAVTATEIDLTPADLPAGALFGNGVEVSAPFAIVGAPTENGGVGAAYVFDSATGSPLYKLTPADRQPGDAELDFGAPLSITGSVAIIGAPETDVGAFDSGAAYLYDLTTGRQLFRLSAGDGQVEDDFGSYVAISGNVALVGAVWHAGSRGAAYVYDVNTGSQLSHITASDAQPRDFFGIVAMDGPTAVIGAHYDDGTRGSAYVFDLTDPAHPVEVSKIIASDREAGDFFAAGGIRVQGRLVAIGAPECDARAGAVYLFDISDPAAPVQLAKVTAPNRVAGDWFGGGIDISGNLLAVGANRDDTVATDSGAAYLFDISNPSSPVPLQKLTASDASAGDRFGAPAIDGNVVLVGAWVKDATGTDSGAAYLYTLDPASSDFGDAPAPYPTTLPENGAQHQAVGPMLGAARDSEYTGIHSAANADDTTGTPDDEDGVTFGPIRVGQLDATIAVSVQNAPAGAKLDAWIDFNADGAWGGPDEQIADRLQVLDGSNTIAFDVPSWAASGATYARFRLSTAGGLGPAGAAANGEVEDYQVTVSLPGASQRSFSAPNIISATANGATAVYAADLDGDGAMDVLWGDVGGDRVMWSRNEGNGHFGQERVVGWSLDQVNSLCTADIDGDGDLDVVAASSRGWSAPTVWYENQGDALSFLPHTIGTNAWGTVSVFVADVDGDGDSDVLTATLYAGASRLLWFENLNRGQSFAAHNLPASFWEAHDVAAADLDRDGDMDVVAAFAGGNALAWYENDGSQTFTERTISRAMSSARSVFATDIDQDGDLDVVSASYLDSKVTWYENDGQQTFTPHVISSSVSGAYDAFPADVDGDGDWDIVSAGYSAGMIAWHENDGHQSFAQHRVATAMGPLPSIFVADVDRDRVLDLLSASGSEGGNNSRVAWYQNLKASPPRANPDSYVLDEDHGLNVLPRGLLTNDTGPDADALTAILVAGGTSHGTLVLHADGSFAYTPDADWNGTDTFQYQAFDGSDYSEPATVTIVVAPVNDAPTFTPGPDQVVDEDAGSQMVVNWAVNISPGPPNEAGQSAQFVVTNDNPGLFSQQPWVSPDGTLTYAPAANAYGGAQVTVVLQDDGGNENGGVDVSAPQTFIIVVNSVIDAVIDVKPGSDVNPINLGSKGVLPIAILSTQVSAGQIDDFDATKVDVTTIMLNGVAIDPVHAAFEDIDGDGDLDLVLHFSMEELWNRGVLDETSVDLLLSADFDGGDALGPDLIGGDAVTIVPPKGKGNRGK